MSEVRYVVERGGQYGWRWWWRIERLIGGVWLTVEYQGADTQWTAERRGRKKWRKWRRCQDGYKAYEAQTGRIIHHLGNGQHPAPWEQIR